MPIIDHFTLVIWADNLRVCRKICYQIISPERRYDFTAYFTTKIEGKKLSKWAKADDYRDFELSDTSSWPRRLKLVAINNYHLPNRRRLCRLRLQSRLVTYEILLAATTKLILEHWDFSYHRPKNENRGRVIGENHISHWIL